jgi:hypothetical protein
MTTAPLSLALVAQALPMRRDEMTTAEGIAVVCALLSVMVVGIWLNWRGNKRK